MARSVAAPYVFSVRGQRGQSCSCVPAVPFEFSEVGAALALAALGRPLCPRCTQQKKQRAFKFLALASSDR